MKLSPPTRRTLPNTNSPPHPHRTPIDPMFGIALSCLLSRPVAGEIPPTKKASSSPTSQEYFPEHSYKFPPTQVFHGLFHTVENSVEKLISYPLFYEFYSTFSQNKSTLPFRIFCPMLCRTATFWWKSPISGRNSLGMEVKLKITKFFPENFEDFTFPQKNLCFGFWNSVLQYCL